MWILVFFFFFPPDTSFATIFPQSMACLILWTELLAGHIFLILTKSSLSVISFMDCASVVVSKMLQRNPSDGFGRAKKKGITTHGVIWGFLLHSCVEVLLFSVHIWTVMRFEFITMKGVRSVSRFFFFPACGCELLQYRFLKGLSLLLFVKDLCSFLPFFFAPL